MRFMGLGKKRGPVRLFLRGARDLGYNAEWLDDDKCYEDQLKKDDIMVAFGGRGLEPGPHINTNVFSKTLSSPTKPRNKILKIHLERGGRLICTETGFIKRRYYRSVGWSGTVNWGDYHNKDMPSDRWDQLDIEIKPWRDDGDHILVTGQMPKDMVVTHVRYLDWVFQTLTKLRELTARPIIFKDHPRMHRKMKIPAGILRSNHRNIKDDLKNAWALLTFNSTTAVDAVLEGIPAFVCDNGSIAHDVSNFCPNIDDIDIENPKMPIRTQWAYNTAYAQWTKPEIREGLPLKHLYKDKP